MRHFLFSLGVVLASSSLVVQAPLPLQASAESHSLISRLETALNASDQEELDALIAPEVRERLAPKMRRFAQRFRNARWSLKVGDLFSDGRLPVSVAVTGSNSERWAVVLPSGSSAIGTEHDGGSNQWARGVEG